MIIASQIPLTVVAGTPDTSGVPSLLLTDPQISGEDPDTLVTRCSLQPQCVPGAARPDGDCGDGDSGGCAHLSGIIIHLFIYKPYNNILIVTTDCNDRLSSELPQLRGVVRAPRHAATHRGHRPTELG